MYINLHYVSHQLMTDKEMWATFAFLKFIIKVTLKLYKQNYNIGTGRDERRTVHL